MDLLGGLSSAGGSSTCTSFAVLPLSVKSGSRAWNGSPVPIISHICPLHSVMLGKLRKATVTAAGTVDKRRWTRRCSRRLLLLCSCTGTA
jgi:hypothetical protein